MKKKNYAWISYIIVVIILLLIILFVIPDKYFAPKKGYNVNNTDTTTEFPFKEYNKMIEEIKENNYTYNYEININTTIYTFDGKKVGNKEQSNFENKDNNINEDLLNINYIFDLIKDITYKQFIYDNTRMYTYKLMLDNLDTEIIIYTDLNYITKILIANKYYQYNLTYKEVGTTIIS